MIYSSWDIERDRLKLVILGHFLPFYSPKNQKNHNFEKMKKIAGDIIILLMRTKNHNHMMYGSWDTEWDTEFFAILEVCQREFSVILDHFLPFDHPDDLKNQNLEKLKETPGGIIILHMCTINDNHMVYGSWDMECERQNFLSFWTIFCPFNPLTIHKIKILIKWKKSLEILSFYTCVP